MIGLLKFGIALARAKRAYPNQRIGQLIVNANGGVDPFYAPDSALARDLHNYVERSG